MQLIAFFFCTFQCNVIVHKMFIFFAKISRKFPFHAEWSRWRHVRCSGEKKKEKKLAFDGAGENKLLPYSCRPVPQMFMYTCLPEQKSLRFFFRAGCCVVWMNFPLFSLRLDMFSQPLCFSFRPHPISLRCDAENEQLWGSSLAESFPSDDWKLSMVRGPCELRNCSCRLKWKPRAP